MKQDAIARALNVSRSVVSRPLKEHRVAVLQKGNGLHWFLSARHYGTWCIIWRPPDTVKGGCWDFERSKVPGQIQESGVRSPLNSLDGQNMVLRDDIARAHSTRIIEEYKNQQNIASLPRPSLLQDLNPIEHVWDKLSWRVLNREQAVSKPLWILLDSTAWARQDFMSWTHAPSELNDENVPSCYSTV